MEKVFTLKCLFCGDTRMRHMRFGISRLLYTYMVIPHVSYEQKSKLCAAARGGAAAATQLRWQ